MANVKNIVVGTALLAVAAYLLLSHGPPLAMGLFFAAALYLYAVAITGWSSDG